MKQAPAARLLARLAVLSLLAAGATSAEVRVQSFRSESLGRDVSYTVDLPASYASGDRRYPVVYALHGLFEGHTFWQRRGLAAVLQALREKGEVPELVVVAIDGGNSFFVNGPKGRYGDLITTDLIAHVESTYRVVPGREGRAIFGVSMGGYAALRLALARPDLFRAAATHSAMLLDAIPSPEQGAGRWHMAAFQAVFGDPIDTALWKSNDPLAAALKADPKAAPALYFDCGSEDRYGLFAGNRDLHQRLTARGIAHTFALHPGDHGYAYVLTVLDLSLRFIGDQFGGPAAPPEAKRPPIVIQSASSGPVSVHYLNIPWGPNTFAAMEKPGDSFYNKRPWPFARFETTRVVTLEGTRIPAGNYALVFHPNTPDDAGMSLEVRRIAVAEFLQAGNVMTAAPEGEPAWKGPVRFAVAPETMPALEIELLRDASGVSLTVRYGDRRLVVVLRD